MISIIDWRITNKCPQNCLYCFCDKTIKTADETNTEIILKKLCTTPVSKICISGGEPLYDIARCKKIMNTLKLAQKRIYLSTSAYFFSKNFHNLLEYVDVLGLPLDGFNNISNTSGGRLNDSFNYTINALKLLSSSTYQSIQLKIGTVLTRENCNPKSLKQIYNLISGYNVNVWRIYELLPENNGYIYYKHLAPSTEQLQQIQEYIHYLNSLSNITIQYINRIDRNRKYFIIQPNGAVILPIDNGTYIDEYSIGNFVTDSFTTLYQKWSANGNLNNSFRNALFKN